MVLTGGIMGGVLIYMVPPMFIDAAKTNPWAQGALAFFAFLMIGGSIVYFILGDQVNWTKKKKGSSYSKGVQEKLKHGIITPEEAVAEQKKEMLLEMEKMKTEIELEKQRYLLEKQKLELVKLKAGPKKENGEKEKFKMPDVLGNISQVVQPAQPQGKAKAKDKDELEDLRNLF